MMSEMMSVQELQECRGPRAVIRPIRDVCWPGKSSHNRVTYQSDTMRSRGKGGYGLVD